MPHAFFHAFFPHFFRILTCPKITCPTFVPFVAAFFAFFDAFDPAFFFELFFFCDFIAMGAFEVFCLERSG